MYSRKAIARNRACLIARTLLIDSFQIGTSFGTVMLKRSHASGQQDGGLSSAPAHIDDTLPMARIERRYVR